MRAEKEREEVWHCFLGPMRKEMSLASLRQTDRYTDRFLALILNLALALRLALMKIKKKRIDLYVS